MTQQITCFLSFNMAITGNPGRLPVVIPQVLCLLDTSNTCLFFYGEPWKFIDGWEFLRVNVCRPITQMPWPWPDQIVVGERISFCHQQHWRNSKRTSVPAVAAMTLQHQVDGSARQLFSWRTWMDLIQQMDQKMEFPAILDSLRCWPVRRKEGERERIVFHIRFTILCHVLFTFTQFAKTKTDVIIYYI